MTAAAAVTARHEISVWFGEHLLAQYTADAEIAQQYAEAMGRQCSGVRITTAPVDPASSSSCSAELPCQRLWSTTTK